MSLPYSYDAELVDSLAMIPPVDFNDVEGNRAAGKAVTDAWAAFIDRTGVTTTVTEVPSQWDGDPAVSVRIHVPENRVGIAPVIIDMHGGGFATASAEVSDGRAVELVRGVGAVVVSVDYRLSPEHPYPAALHDCYSVLRWVAANHAELGVDAERIALLGQSAGGGLAAGLALFARDQGGPAIAFQYLGVPEIDDTLDTPSMQAYTDTPFWNLPNAVLSWQFYLGDLHGGDDIPLYAAPARASVSDLIGLPPAYITAMQFDPLRDEDIAFAAKLAQAGVPTELHLFPQTFHASFVIGTANVSQREVAEQVVVFRRALTVG